MLTASDTAYIRLNSSPYMKRVGLWPLAVGVAVGWIFVVLWAIVAIMSFAYNTYWAIVIAGSTCTFAALLGYTTHILIHDACKEYIFEFTDSEAVMYLTDRLKHKQSTQMILLSDVKYAEYYPYLDSTSIILDAGYTQMEIPLWPLGKRSQDVIDFLSGRGITIVNTQSDDKIPLIG